MDFQGDLSGPQRQSHHVHTGSVASDMGIDGDADHTIMAWAFADSFGSGLVGGGIWCVGSSANETDQLHQIAMRTTTSSEPIPVGEQNEFMTGYWGFDNQYAIDRETGVWHHWTQTYTVSDSTSRTYVDGVEAETLTLTGNNSVEDTENLVFGQFDYLLFPAPAHGYTYFNGRIADARVYDRVLIPNEIMTIYSSRGRDGIVSGLLRRYPMRGIVGDTSFDHLIAPTSFDGSDGVVAPGASTITPTLPTNAEGDLLVAIVVSSGETGSPPVSGTFTETGSSGWTEQLEILFDSFMISNNTSAPSVYIFTKIAGASEGNPTFTCSETTGLIAYVNTYRNASEPAMAGDFIMSSSIEDDASDSTECPSVTINTDTTNGTPFLTLRILVADGTDAVTSTNIKGTAYRGERALSETGSNGVYLAVQEELRSGNTTQTRLFEMNATQERVAITACFASNPQIKDVAGADYHPHHANPQGDDADFTDCAVFIEDILR